MSCAPSHHISCEQLGKMQFPQQPTGASDSNDVETMLAAYAQQAVTPKQQTTIYNYSNAVPQHVFQSGTQYFGSPGLTSPTGGTSGATSFLSSPTFGGALYLSSGSLSESDIHDMCDQFVHDNNPTEFPTAPKQVFGPGHVVDRNTSRSSSSGTSQGLGVSQYLQSSEDVWSQFQYQKPAPVDYQQYGHAGVNMQQPFSANPLQQQFTALLQQQREADEKKQQRLFRAQQLQSQLAMGPCEMKNSDLDIILEHWPMFEGDSNLRNLMNVRVRGTVHAKNKMDEAKDNMFTIKRITYSNPNLDFAAVVKEFLHGDFVRCFHITAKNGPKCTHQRMAGCTWCVRHSPKE